MPNITNFANKFRANWRRGWDSILILNNLIKYDFLWNESPFYLISYPEKYERKNSLAIHKIKCRPRLWRSTNAIQ